MFSKVWPDQMPSHWRLSVLMALIVLSSIMLTLTFVRLAVQHDMEEMQRRSLTADLQHYAALYQLSGVSGVKEVFSATQANESQALRLLDNKRQVLLEVIPETLLVYDWPAMTQRPLIETGEMGWQELGASDLTERLQLGAIRLEDGSTLWCGRTDGEAQRHLANVQNHLWVAWLIAALTAVLPVLWYAHDVVGPIQSFIISAERLRLPGGEARLRSAGAIPELKALATVVNASMDQILGLTRELQSTNDHLAHELRTPLARIRGNLESLHDHSDKPTVQESAARSLEEVDRATQLVQTLLTVRAGDHGALRLYRQVTAVHDLLINLVELYAPAAEERRQKLKLEPGLDLTLKIDRELLNQAVANLLDNALAYTPPGGEITLRWLDEGTGAIITVEDTGPGIAPAEMESIWDRYSRGSAASRKTPGMGLGLNLVRSIATAHGGSAGAQNRDGGGSLFWIHIPGV